MQNKAYVTFRIFNTLEQVEELSSLFIKNNLEFIIDDTTPPFDPSFANNQTFNEFRVKLKKENFQKAEEILLAVTESQINDVNPDYYLFSFDDDELYEIVSNRDTWNEFDFLLAQKILKERGKEINALELNQINQKRFSELSKTENCPTTLILIGYFLAIAGGAIGIFVGYYVKSHKKTLPNGDEIFVYSENDRRHGKNIFKLGIAFFIFWVSVQILSISSSN